MSDAEPTPIVRAVVILAGRVQNVGFREGVLQIAQRHTVAGTVRNLRSGDRLEIDVEGSPRAVDTFIADVIAHPPRAAHIESIERRAAQPRGVTRFERASTG